MDLRDLNKINIEDLKEVDWTEVRAHLQSRPDVIINALLVIVMLIVVVSTYRSNTSSIKSLKSQIPKLEEKHKALKKFETSQKDHAEFLKNIPEIISENRLIEILSEFALKRNIQIISFLPSKEQSNDYVRLTKVTINIKSDNYPDIIKFIHDIEDSAYSIRIGEWVGGSKNSSTARRRGRKIVQTSVDENYIGAMINIESVEFKNE